MPAEAAQPDPQRQNQTEPHSTADSPGLQRCREELSRKIEQGKLRLPMLPQVAGQVLSISNDPNADISELSKLIHQDQALAGHVLRISNSAAYGGGESIVSLQQAVTRLGMKLLSEIAIAVSLQGDVFRVPHYQDQIKLIWRHALASGAYGKEAARMKRSNVESQFLCGLLHTVGKPVLLKTLTEMHDPSVAELTPDAAVTLLDEFHETVGQTLAQEWKLPEQVSVVCAHYRNYQEAPSFKEETAMTYLVDQLAAWLVIPQVADDGETVLKDDPVFEFLNFYPDEVQELLEKKEQVLSVVNAMDL